MFTSSTTNKQLKALNHVLQHQIFYRISNRNRICNRIKPVIMKVYIQWYHGAVNETISRQWALDQNFETAVAIWTVKPKV